MYKELCDEIIKIGKRCGEKNYTPGTTGNISARYKDKIIITTTGSANGYLTKDDLCVMDFDGNLVKGSKKPSSEKMLHSEFYRVRSDVNFIIHVHPAALSAFASANKDLMQPVMAENVFYFGGIPLAEYGLPSSMDLVHKTAKHFSKFDAVLMANHGFVIGSTNATDAYYKLEMAEAYAQTVLNTMQLGGPHILTPAQAAEVEALR